MVSWLSSWTPLTAIYLSNFFQAMQPVRVKILWHDFYTLRGPANIKALFRASSSCTSIPFVKFALGHAFGLPAKALRLFDKDDSGGGPVPYPGSTVEARNRIDYLNHQSVAQFLEGKGLVPFWERFVDNITKQLRGVYETLDLRRWDDREDLMRTIGDETTVAILNSLCGPHLLELNPHFLQDFREFDRNLQTYLQGTYEVPVEAGWRAGNGAYVLLILVPGIPWFLAPGAYAARKRVLNAVRVWQQYARAHFDDSTVDSNGDDPFWGSSFFRDRQKLFLDMDGFDHSAITSLDFGAIWA